MHSKYSTILIPLFLTVVLSASPQKHIVILHTNDTHSRIEPLPMNDKKNPDKGGVVRRANYIDQIRKEYRNVLLLDAGDFLQGTPYFNLFKGAVEIEAMNRMQYDAVTLGNHEFDYGMDQLKTMITAAKFPIVISNYDFSQTALHGLTQRCLVLQKEGIRIGILAIGVNPKGLIAADNYKGMVYLDPIGTANEVATELRLLHRCDLVICLSHIGYENDILLAEKSRNIDLIIGGHSHTYMKEADIRRNSEEKEVMIVQTNGHGIYVGRIDMDLEKVP